MSPREMLGLKMYSVKEISEITKVTVRTITNYIKDKRLQAQKIGGVWYVSEENLKRFLEGETTGKS